MFTKKKTPGEKSDAQKVVREAVIGILRYHENSRNENGTICIMGKYHDILYVALKICFDWQLKDTATVATLLDHIYSCEKTFERLFVGAIFGTRAPHFIAGWKSDFDDQEDNVRAVVYFLDHACNANLEYCPGEGSDSTRFVDVPLESCGKATCLKITLQLGVPDKVLILLRFGAVVDEECLTCLLSKLSDYHQAYPYNLVACLQLVLRAIPSVNTDNGAQQRVAKSYGELIVDGLLPLNRCGFEPVPLKHLCRCEIRRALWRSYQLPGGIGQLPVPKKLHQYLDLLAD